MTGAAVPHRSITGALIRLRSVRLCLFVHTLLRAGEVRALAWTDVSFDKRQLRVERKDWGGQVSSTKGGRLPLCAPDGAAPAAAL